MSSIGRWRSANSSVPSNSTLEMRTRTLAYGITYLVPQGRADEALHEMQVARDLDPLSPVEANYLGLAYQFNGRQSGGHRSV